VIVVCGDLPGHGERRAFAQTVAVRAAGEGARVELVGVIPDNPEGDRRLLELSGARVGHAAVLRAPDRALEPEDVDLALRYLPEIRVIVCVGLPAAILAKASEGAGWLGAALVVVRSGAAGTADEEMPLADGAVVLEAPPSDPDGTFAGFVGAFAARVDAGATPADAWAATTRDLHVDPIDIPGGPGRSTGSSV